VPSSADGVISEILIKSGAVVKVGQPIFKIEGGVAAPSAAPATPASKTTDSVVKSISPVASVPEVPAPKIAETTIPIPIRKDIPAAPSVRLLARELGIDLALVPSSSPSGRISNDDVKAYCKMLNSNRSSAVTTLNAAIHPLPNFEKWGTIRREAMSNVRKKTAEHLSYAWQTIPHVTQFDKVDITELEKLRKSISGTNKRFPSPLLSSR